jgi:uncharacterized protein YjdB
VTLKFSINTPEDQVIETRALGDMTDAIQKSLNLWLMVFDENGIFVQAAKAEVGDNFQHNGHTDTQFTVTLNKTSATLTVGDTLALKASIPSGTYTPKYTWSSSNKKVATVTQKGEVKAIGEGTATITVKTANGKKATCKITVPKAPTKVTLSKTKATLVAGAKLTLKAKLNPAKAKTTLTWSSSNKKVAMVSKNGVVKALKAGTATITVRTANGKKATCKVTVPKAPTKVAFAQKSYSVKAGKKITLKTKLTPDKAKTTLTWSSSNKKIATVTQKGVVKGIRKGTVTITVKTANGKKATVKVTVK